MKLAPTNEQQKIIEAAKQDKNLIVKAYAGSAKTSTCVMIAEELNKYSLYCAFNKSIANEAKNKFPSTVSCRTMHSLAYGSMVMNKMRNKLQGWFQQSDIDLLGYDFKNETETKLRIIEYIKLFCQSSYLNISMFKPAGLELTKLELLIAHKFWKNIVCEDNPTKMTHDVYLKLFQLSQPILGYETIYLDEAQDSSEVVLDIVLQQRKYGTQIIIVGDSFQSIYAWRGAVNALNKLPSKEFETLYLTKSFRFTQEIAATATKIINYIGNDKQITGVAKEKPCKNRATIVRNNTTLLSHLLNAYNRNEKVFVLADLKSLWGKLYHIQALFFGDSPRYPDAELKQYKTYKELLKAAETIPEIAKLIRLSELLGKNRGLTKSINEIKSIVVKREEDADITLTTGHKSKGLEWDEVTLTDDFLTVKEGEDAVDKLYEDQTAELIYVALTRAKYKVNLPETIEDLLLQ